MSERVWNVVPHFELALRVVPVPASRGIAAHNDWLATTACGIEVAATLATRSVGRVKCARCRARMGADRDDV